MGNTDTGVIYLSWEPRRKQAQIKKTLLIGNVALGIHTYNLQNPVPEKS